MDKTTDGAAFRRTGKWIVAGVVLSFFIGIGLFATIGMQRIGTPIPMDASASEYEAQDAGGSY